MDCRCSFLTIAGGLLAGLPALAGAGAGAGLNFGLDLTVEASGGLSGGIRQGAALQGLALGQVQWLHASNSSSGLRFAAHGSVLGLTGRGPTERFVGDFLAASNIEGFASVRLYSWWFEAGHGEWSARGGALLADEEFAGTDGGGNFFNSAFGWPAFLSANTVNTGPAFFVPALGFRLDRTWGKSGAWRIGVYDGDTFDSASGDPWRSRHGWRYQVGGDQGWFAISEATFAPGDSPTRCKVGGWVHSATFSDVSEDGTGRPFATTGGDPRAHASNYGAFAAVERTVKGRFGAPGSLELFIRGGVSPADRNTLHWAVDGGLSWTGLLSARPADVASLGLAHAAFSSRYARHALAVDPTGPASDFEQVVEASYNFAVSERWTLQPDVQYIRHPGGSSRQRDALVFLLRSNCSF